MVMVSQRCHGKNGFFLVSISVWGVLPNHVYATTKLGQAKFVCFFLLKKKKKRKPE